jgi:hypothetical protein
MGWFSADEAPADTLNGTDFTVLAKRVEVLAVVGVSA